jgi:hypothetical protein
LEKVREEIKKRIKETEALLTNSPLNEEINQEVYAGDKNSTTETAPVENAHNQEINSQSTNSNTGNYSGGDKDCSDFATHSEAQAFFEAAGAGDPHRLDRDGDNMACEDLP